MTANPMQFRAWLVIIVTSVLLAYSRLFHAGFSGLDDDLHVYANPYLNPPTLASVETLWRMPYQGLYVPLAYTIFAVIAHYSRMPETFIPSMGQIITVNPIPFHVVNIFLHAANSLLVFILACRLTKSQISALFCSLIFALHPLQVESVGWVSELRGLSGSFFCLIALNLFLAQRRLTAGRMALSIALYAAATIALVCGMLCKPSIITLPFVVIAIDRIMLGTTWRRTLTLAAIWTLCTLPFLVITHFIQAVDFDGRSIFWQRPFIAGDALAFYLGKLIVPLHLCIDYGRTPSHLMAHWWAYLSWTIPALGLTFAYRLRRKHPLVWLGALIYVLFLLPECGIVPFSFQNYSTVGDRYAYLSMIGIGLICAEAFDSVNRRAAICVACTVCAAMAAMTFNQTRYWMSESAFLEHTLACNPHAAFAYNNLGQVFYGNQEYVRALQDMLQGRALAPGEVNIDIDTANCYFALGRIDLAKSMLRDALHEPSMTADDYSDMGNLLMKMNDPQHGLQALAIAVSLSEGKPSCLFNYGTALASVGQFGHAEAVLRRCIAVAPSIPGPYESLGVVLAQTGRLPEAIADFQTALNLDPSDPKAQADLAQAQQLLAGRPPQPTH